MEIIEDICPNPAFARFFITDSEYSAGLGNGAKGCNEMGAGDIRGNYIDEFRDSVAYGNNY